MKEEKLPTFEDLQGAAAESMHNESSSIKVKNAKKGSKAKPKKLLASVFAGSFLTNQKISSQFPFILFLTVVAIIYVANGYIAEKNVRKLTKLEKEIEELETIVISSRSDKANKTKQSEISKLSSQISIYETRKAPYKIEMTE